MKAKIGGLAFAGLIAWAPPASAHHSFAMFDGSKTVAIAGTVKQLEEVNPHGWLQVMVMDAQGQANPWSIEMGGPGQLSAMGLTQQSIKPGDKVTVNIHPLRDGSYGGQFVSVTLPNGDTFGRGGRIRGGN